MSRKSLLNRAAVRAQILKVCRETHRPFNRVSQTFLDGLEQVVLESIYIRVHRHPSIGQTLRDK